VPQPRSVGTLEEDWNTIFTLILRVVPMRNKMTGFGTGCVEYFGSTPSHANDHHPYHCSYQKSKCFHERYCVVKDTLRCITGSINLSFDFCTCF
jgi:hypothetical protein